MGGRERPESFHSLDEGTATIDVHGQGVHILLRRHSCAVAEFLRILPQ
jgi:hypothetical protein